MKSIVERPILFSAEMVRAILDGRKTQTRRVAPIRELNILQHPGDMITWTVSFLKAVKGVLSSHSGGKFSDLQARSIIASQFNPYGKPGDTLWVREAWCLTRDTLDWETGGEASSYEWDEDLYGDPRQHLSGDQRSGVCAALHYPADGEDNTPSEMWPCIGLNGKVLRKKEIRWRPSIHMPRWASRITIEVKSVRVERLQDITEDDARAEGCEARPFPGPWWQGYRDLGDGQTIHQQAIGETAPDWMIEPKQMPPTPWLDISARDGFRSIWMGLYGPDAWDENPWVWVIEFERVKP